MNAGFIVTIVTSFGKALGSSLVGIKAYIASPATTVATIYGCLLGLLVFNIALILIFYNELVVKLPKKKGGAGAH